MTNKEAALRLLDECIEQAKKEDAVHKAQAIANNKAEQAVGESFMVHHLKALRGLIENGDEWYTM
tara:strand:+ start:912 stop:1106 length:195 start_codon:yes stop_codon:yes gene_type:complete